MTSRKVRVSPYAQAVSRKVRMLAAGAGVSRGALADALGVDRGALTARLNDKRELSLSDVELLAPVLGVTPAQITNVSVDA